MLAGKLGAWYGVTSDPVRETLWQMATHQPDSTCN